MRRVVILDQFTGPSPYWLSQNPTPFAELATNVLEHPEHYSTSYGHKPEVREVPDDFSPAMCTTVFAEDEQGNAFAWKYRWDSSG